MAKSPVSIPFTTDGVEISVKDATTLPTDARGTILVGKDGTTSRFVNVDSLGRVVVVGLGTAGTPSGGVVSVQGVASGTVLPVSDGGGSLTVDGTVTANQGTPGTHSNRWTVGLSDGSTFISPATDRSTAAAPFSVRLSDGTTFYIGPSTSQFPSSLVGGRLDINTGSWLGSTAPTVGQKTMTNSLPVVVSSDQSTLPVSAASLPLPAGAATETTLAAANTKLAGGLPAALVGARLDTNIGAWLGSTAPTVGQKTGAASIPYVAASDQWPDALARSIFVKCTDGTNVAPTGDAVARSVFSQISDGTTGPVAVKPASTQPVVGDKALVVVLSPNQAAIPTTTAPLNSVPLLSMGDVTLAIVTTAAIRRTAYTEQSANFTGSVSSNNAADSAAGAGMRSMRITWMNSTGTTVGTEDVNLNGTTPVNLVTTTKCFIDKIEGLTWGANGTNTGIISLFTGAAGAGTLVGTIAATNNRTFWAHHYVQSGKIGNVTSVFHGNSSTVSGGTSVAVLRRKAIAANSGEVQISDFIRISGAVNSLPRNYGSVVQVIGPARIMMYVTTSSSSSIVYTGSFDSYDV